MGRPRGKKGDQRIDAAIDHLVPYGFTKTQIRKVIRELLKVYGQDGWIFLEEGSYDVVRERLLEEQAKQDQEQAAVATEEASPQNVEVSRVDDEAPSESQSAFERQSSPNSSSPLEYVLPLPAANEPPRSRAPCYGWLSSESETESEKEDGEMGEMVWPVVFPEMDIPNPVETLPSKRKRASRWDVRPNW